MTKKPKEEEEMLTVQQAAEQLGISVSMVYKLEREGKLKAVNDATGAGRIQRRLSFAPSEISAYIERVQSQRKHSA